MPVDDVVQQAVQEEPDSVSGQVRALVPAGDDVLAKVSSCRTVISAWAVRKATGRNVVLRGQSQQSRAWFPVEQLPFEEMWDDARYWLPQVLAAQAIEAEIVFAEDCETVAEATVNSAQVTSPQ
ncbi:hypothetical protein ACIHCQ_05455 [Streptomyces sp. NPDC052236]|uniref:hypothetical protein n=1 Tax=Streptomyces sp. NPDC052236 TaxID=3365686 RepID=UPI0037D07190